MPTLANRLQDLAVVYARGCHAKPSGFKVKTCTFTYGRAAGRKTVVLTGDSHAAHWFPAVDLVARHRGWRLDLHDQVILPRGGCHAHQRRRRHPP